MPSLVNGDVVLTDEQGFAILGPDGNLKYAASIWNNSYALNQWATINPAWYPGYGSPYVGQGLGVSGDLVLTLVESADPTKLGVRFPDYTDPTNFTWIGGSAEPRFYSWYGSYAFSLVRDSARNCYWSWGTPLEDIDSNLFGLVKLDSELNVVDWYDVRFWDSSNNNGSRLQLVMGSDSKLYLVQPGWQVESLDPETLGSQKDDPAGTNETTLVVSYSSSTGGVQHLSIHPTTGDLWGFSSRSGGNWVLSRYSGAGVLQESTELDPPYGQVNSFVIKRDGTGVVFVNTDSSPFPVVVLGFTADSTASLASASELYAEEDSSAEQLYVLTNDNTYGYISEVADAATPNIAASLGERTTRFVRARK